MHAVNDNTPMSHQIFQRAELKACSLVIILKQGENDSKDIPLSFTNHVLSKKIDSSPWNQMPNFSPGFMLMCQGTKHQNSFPVFAKGSYQGGKIMSSAGTL